MSRIIKRNVVEIKEGFYYYIDSEGNLCESDIRVRKDLNLVKLKW